MHIDRAIDRPKSIRPPKQRIVEWVLEMNRRSSREYIDAGPLRDQHWGRHPTRMGAFLCMDGRVELPSITHTPRGFWRKYRALGGAAKLFWPGLRNDIRMWLRETPRRNVLFPSYHYSGSQDHLGCAGWEYRTQAARVHAQNLAAQITRDYPNQIVGLPLGVETDFGEMVIHGPERDVRTSALIGADVNQIEREILHTFSQSMDEQMARDLAVILESNARHVDRLKRNPPPIEQNDHQERVFALGRVLDWIDRRNIALKLNHFDPNLDHAVNIAVKILEHNMKSAPDGDEALILVCMPFSEPGSEEYGAETDAVGLMNDFVLPEVRRNRPHLVASGRLHYMAGVVDKSRRLFRPLEHGLVRPD